MGGPLLIFIRETGTRSPFISHMIDCQLWSLQPRGHHLSNVLLHVATTILLLLALRTLTGRLWCSALPWRSSRFIRCGSNQGPGSRSGKICASIRHGPRAVSLAGKANQIVGELDPIYLRTLAVAYAEAGRFDDAIKIAARALPLAEAEGNAALAFDLRNNIAGHQHGEPVRDTSLGP